MNHQELILFFLQICVMLAVALVFGQVMRRFKQPAVLGELIGGVLLGPTVFGALVPPVYAWLFPTDGEILLSREAVINIGMLFFLFVAGLEVDLRHLRRRGLSVAFTSILGIVVPFSLGFGSVLSLPGLWGPQPHAKDLLFALFIGIALSISALPVIARILMDLDMIHDETSVIVMAAATINDFIGWSLFALILSAFMPGSLRSGNVWITLGLLLGLSVLTVSIGQWGGHRGLQWLQSHLAWPSSVIGITTVLVLVAAAAVEALGFHAVFGAFLVGVALAQTSDERNGAHEVVYQFAISFFAPLYFVSIGLKANFVTNFDLPLVLLVLFIACVGKIGGAGFGAWAGGMPLREALAVGFGMNARGAMEMILASVALEYKLISERVFVALIVMAVVTSMLSGPVMQRLLKPRLWDNGGGSRKKANGG